MSAELSPKRLELLKEALPALSRVAFLYYPDDPAPEYGLQLSQSAAPKLGLKIDAFPECPLWGAKRTSRYHSGQVRSRACTSLAGSVQLGHDLAAWARLRRHDCSPLPRTVLAAMDKYLAPSNKSCMADKATKERNHQ